MHEVDEDRTSIGSSHDVRAWWHGEVPQGAVALESISQKD